MIIKSQSEVHVHFHPTVLPKITLQQKSFLLNQTHIQAFYLSCLVFTAFSIKAKREDGSRAVRTSNKRTSDKSQPEVRLHTGCSVHFHPSQFTRPFFLNIRGSGSETRCSQCGVGKYVHVRLTCGTFHTFFLFSNVFLVTTVMVARPTCFEDPDAFPWKPSPHTLALVHFSCICVCNSKTTTYL